MELYEEHLRYLMTYEFKKGKIVGEKWLESFTQLMEKGS